MILMMMKYNKSPLREGSIKVMRGLQNHDIGSIPILPTYK
jgi:hypothetical protein